MERTPSQPTTPEVTFGPKTDSIGNPSITCLLKRHEGTNYLFAVNATCESVAAKLAIPDAKSVEVLYEDRTASCNDGALTEGFAPFAVHIYRWR